MKCASIDIGTNTILLLIGDIGNDIREIVDISSITRLGEGLQSNGYLLDAPMARSLEVLREYSGIAESLKADHIYCVGTSALREAHNSPLFLDMVKNETGISIEIISGQQEAYYTYLSIRHDDTVKGEPVLINWTVT